MMERKNKAQRKFVSLLECICKHSIWKIQILIVLHARPRECLAALS